MKNIKVLLIALSLAGVVNSCTRELDIEPKGTPSLQNFWKTEGDLKAAANAMYENFGEEEFYSRGFWWYIDASDDMVPGRLNKPEANEIKKFDIALGKRQGGYTGDQWKFRYTVIRRANDIIKNVDKVNTDQQIKNNYLGEAYFLSGLMYFQLASNYGNDKMGVPIIPTDPNYVGDPVPRTANVTENYNYLIDQLKKAADLLPMIGQQELGRPHKVAAWAMIAKAYLYMKDWKNAEVWATKVMNEGGRSINIPYADVFKAANNYGPEYIWSASSNPSQAWGCKLPTVMLSPLSDYNGWGYYLPTKELYDEFEKGDVRREVTILKNGDTFTFNGTQRVFKGTSQTPTGYQFNKYMDPFKNAINGTHVHTNSDKGYTDLNIPLIRYAEVILINAEAKLMQGKNADAEINMIRKRAGLAAKTGATMADLKHERRCELAGEWADRHRDLVRWGDAQAAYAKPLHNMDGSVAWGARNFNPAVHNVWPVPYSTILESGGVIKQNEGW